MRHVVVFSCAFLVSLGCASANRHGGGAVTSEQLREYGREIDACVQSYAPVRQQFERATRTFGRNAQQLQHVAFAYDALLADQDRVSVHLTQAIDDNEQAITLYRASQVLMLLLTLRHEIEAQRREHAHGAKDLVCEAFTSADCLALKLTSGMDPHAYECDHIVPLALGGANTADNIRIVPREVNRSWGATWNAAKCLEVGPAMCAAAVAVSVACGSYRGGIP